MKTTGLVAALIALVPIVLSAHHSLANHDTTKAVRVKGTIVQFHQINPHSIFYLDEKIAEGQIRRWAVEGPAGMQLGRRGLENVVKVGDVVEVCGYVPKEPVVWQIQNPNSGAVSTSGRLITAELLVMPDGREQSWGDYGVHRCFGTGYTDQHSK